MWDRLDVVDAWERSRRSKSHHRSSTGPARWFLWEREIPINTYGAYVRHVDEDMMGVCKGSDKATRHA